MTTIASPMAPDTFTPATAKAMELLARARVHTLAIIAPLTDEDVPH